jgi:hypothetical protein
MQTELPSENRLNMGPVHRAAVMRNGEHRAAVLNQSALQPHPSTHAHETWQNSRYRRCARPQKISCRSDDRKVPIQTELPSENRLNMGPVHRAAVLRRADLVVFLAFDDHVGRRALHTSISICRARSCDFFAIQKCITCHIGPGTPSSDGSESISPADLKGPTRLVCAYYVGDALANFSGYRPGEGPVSGTSVTPRVSAGGVLSGSPKGSGQLPTLPWQLERILSSAICVLPEPSVLGLRVNRKSFGLTGKVTH